MRQRLVSWVLFGLLLTVAAPSSLANPVSPTSGDMNSGEDVLQQGFALMQAERVGDLRLGLSEREVRQRIRCKLERGKEVYWGATGEYVEQWQYPACGISLNMSSDKAGGSKQLLSIRINAPSKLKTGRGIGIGSPVSKVMQAYGELYNPPESQPGQTIVAGTIYGGVIFILRNDRVSEIFVGAAAE